MKKRVAEANAKDGFILNGYPRTMPQAQALETFALPTQVIDLALTDEEAIARLSGRRVCSICGRNYHLTHNPPKKEGVCDIEGASLTIRDDDKPEAVRTRLAIYRKDTEPLFDFYRPRGIVHTINAAQTIEQVFGEIARVLH